jgi:hypothetical protein
MGTIELQAVRRVRAALCDPAVIAAYRTDDRYFTRRRKLGFDRVVALIVAGHRRSMQSAVSALFSDLNEVNTVATDSAYCQNRRKLKPEFFVYLREALVEEFYAACPQQERRLWCGRRLVGCDSSIICLPEGPDIAEAFQRHGNEVPGAGVLQGQTTVCYDLLHRVALSAALHPRQKLSHLLAEHHLMHLQQNDVLIGDREFGDSGIMALLIANQRDFIIRLQRKTLTAVREFMASAAVDETIEVKVSANQRAFCQDRNLPQRLRVRLVKIDLSSGETEILVTSLSDTQRYSREDLGRAYGYRWNVETYFDWLKNIFEIERFSSAQLQNVLQDFHGIVFLSTFESILSHSAERELQERSQEREVRYSQSVNRAQSYAALLDRVVLLLCDAQCSDQQVVEELHRLMLMKPNLVRPGRNFPRTRQRTRQQWRYQKYRRRFPT